MEENPILNRRVILYILLIILLLFVCNALTGADFGAFFRWYLILFLLGAGFYPLGRLIFRDFSDHGWMFSKILGLAVSGYVVWVLAELDVVAFTRRRSLVVTVILCGFLWVVFLSKQTGGMPDIRLIMAEEVLFLFLLVCWTYMIGFRPEASGTEKFMDYGFMAAMDRSMYLPARDMWYGSKGINYYYGGQFYAVYLSKLSYTDVSLGYNLMRATVAAFAFVLPFITVYHMLQIRMGGMKGSVRWPALAGLLAGTAVSIAGNMHYVLYGLFGKVLKLSGYEDYWFPSSTRYIGHNPDTMDKTIHEFPSYSSILGDLHAHYINIIFVLTLTGLLFAWLRAVHEKDAEHQRRMIEKEERQRHRPDRYVQEGPVKIVSRFIFDKMQEPRLILAAFLIGIFHWTNYWDCIIYYTVTLFCIISAALYRNQHRPGLAAATVAVHAAEVFLISQVTALPFTLNFETMVTGVALAQNHSALYQLAILWGLPLAVALVLAIEVFGEYRRAFRKNASGKEGTFEYVWQFFRLVRLPDRFALILALCGFGLILIPELVYVRDIYEEGFARSNTMFKLTYQAYILLAIVMAYGLVRMFIMAERKLFRYASVVLGVLFMLTVGYFPYAVSEWFSGFPAPSAYQGLSATAFVREDYPEDAGAIEWLNTHVHFQPVVLEAYGDSYSEDCRVSAMTGLPTVEGWYVHEWLWRSDPGDLNLKRLDIDELYTTEDVERAADLAKKHNISFVFVGSRERARYPELNEDTVKSLGTVVYEEGSTFIVRVSGGEAEQMFPGAYE